MFLLFKFTRRELLRLNGGFHYFRNMSVQLSGHDIDIIREVRKILPDLDADHHKGQHGRIGVLGGSEEYTGAPFFAGISALRVGADLVHVFCAQAAAQPIKSYSPDLIVHPLLDRPEAVPEIAQWLLRLHVLVIGPGLGQNEAVMENVQQLLRTEEIQGIQLVIDADGLKLAEFIAPLVGLRGVMTPNAMEYKRMEGRVVENGRFLVMQKGTRDVIGKYLGAAFQGSGRRCGGQGDLLAGSIATMLHWASCAGVEEPGVVACRGASLLIRLCNYEAFQKRGRGMLAADMVEEIPGVFKRYFEGDREE